MNVYDMEQHLWNASALIGSDSLDAAARELAACEQLNEQIKDPYLTYQMQVHQARLAMKQGDIKKAVAYTDLYEPMMDLDWWPMAQRQRGEALQPYSIRRCTCTRIPPSRRMCACSSTN